MRRDLRRGSLVVSCQAAADHPLHGAAHMRAMALAVAQGGAGGIRAEGAVDIAAIRAAVDLPVIGLRKRRREGYDVYITPGFADAAEMARAGADVVALDATRGRRDGEPVDALIPRIKVELGVAVMADIATEEEGLAAAGWGADYVGTTLAGYTAATAHRTGGPDLDLLAALVARCPVPVIAEGRFATPAQVARAFELGAFAVVVGTAITDPRAITARFAAAVPPEGLQA